MTLEQIAESLAVNGKWGPRAMNRGNWKWLKRDRDALDSIMVERCGPNDGTVLWAEVRHGLKEQVEWLAQRGGE